MPGRQTSRANYVVFTVDESDDFNLKLRYVRGFGSGLAFAATPEVMVTPTVQNFGDPLREAAIGLIRTFAHLPEDQSLDVMLIHTTARAAIERLSDFACGTLSPVAQGYFRDYLEVSPDGAEIAFETPGAERPIMGFLQKDGAVEVLSIRTLREGDQEAHIACRELAFVPLYIIEEAPMTAPQRLVDKVHELLHNATFGGLKWSARSELLNWFWAAAAKLQDPLMSKVHGEALHRHPGQVRYSAGSDAEVASLFQAAIAVNAMASEDEFKRSFPRWFARAVVTSAAGAGNPASVRGTNFTPRLLPVLQEIVAWANPRGEQIVGYGYNRRSGAITGGVKQKFGMDVEHLSAHQALAAVALLSEFLGSRGYDDAEIEELLATPDLPN